MEVNCAILCASLPTLRPLFGKIIPGLASSGRPSEYKMYGAGHNANKPAGSAVRSHASEMATGSTEALQKPSRTEYKGAVEYEREVGQSNCVTTIHGGGGGHKNADTEWQFENAAVKQTPRSAKEILVTRETLVEQDIEAGRRGRNQN